MNTEFQASLRRSFSFVLPPAQQQQQKSEDEIDYADLLKTVGKVSEETLGFLFEIAEAAACEPASGVSFRTARVLDDKKL